MPISEVPSSQIRSDPYAKIGIVFVTWPNGDQTSASCAVVGLNDILTAGHVVYNPDRGGWATDFEFYFGADYNDQRNSFDSYNFSYSLTDGYRWVVNAWTNQLYSDSNNSKLLNSESQYDVALIGVSQRIGDTTGWFGLDWDRDYTQSVTQVGYPAGSTGMMFSTISVTKNYYYSIYESSQDLMGPGSSGGPLFTSDGYIIGVKSGGDGTGASWADIGLISSQLYDFLYANDYLIGVTKDDFSSSTSTVGRLTVGGSTTGVIETVSDKDWFAVSLTSGITYKFNLESLFGGLGDPMLKLYNSSGFLLLSDDDSGLLLDSEINYTASSTGTFYLEAQSSTSPYASGSQTGAYRLSASNLSPTYSVTAVSTSFDEGTNANFKVAVTNLPAGSTISYQISGVTASDILGGQLTGTAVIASNMQASISIGLVSDKLTEGPETLTVTVQGKSSSTVVNDTSIFKGPAAADLVYVFKSEKIGVGINPASFSYFYTASVQEANSIKSQANWPWIEKTATFEAAHSNPTLAVPVYRFWSEKHQSHFFTINKNEKDQIIGWSLTGQNGYDWKYEGENFKVYTSAAPTDDLGKSAIPVYRIWMDDKDFNPVNGLSGGHYFTASKDEYDAMVKLVGVKGESVAFYGEVPGN